MGPFVAPAASVLLALGERDGALATLRAMDRDPGIRANPEYPAYLPEMVRTAVSAGDVDLAGRLSSEVDPLYGGHRHALLAARAILAEARGELEDAVDRYGDAAQAWRSFEHSMEEALAHLGRGRCLVALGRPADASESLEAARRMLAGMEARPGVEEIDGLLAT